MKKGNEFFRFFAILFSVILTFESFATSATTVYASSLAEQWWQEALEKDRKESEQIASYNITYMTDGNGTIQEENREDKAMADNYVTVDTTANVGYALSSWIVMDANSNVVEYCDTITDKSFTFVMPNKDVTVYAYFEEIQKNSITVISGENITIGSLMENEVYSGEEVSLSVTTSEGYIIDSLYYTTESEEEPVDIKMLTPGMYSFTMPNDNITIHATAIEGVKHDITFMAENEYNKETFELSKSKAYKGEQVAIYATSDLKNALYSFKIVTTEESYLAEKQEGSKTWTFIMPNEDVQIEVYQMTQDEYKDVSNVTSNQELSLDIEETVTTKRSLLALFSAATQDLNTDYPSHKQTAKSEKADFEPDITITKNAHWTDIEQGYAEITLTEKDTPKYSDSPVDWLFILDRSDSTIVSEWNIPGIANNFNSNSNNFGQTPCQNTAHYYMDDSGTRWFPMSFGGDGAYGIKYSDLGNLSAKGSKITTITNFTPHYNAADGTRFANSKIIANGKEFTTFYGSTHYTRVMLEASVTSQFLSYIKDHQNDKINNLLGTKSYVSGWMFGGYGTWGGAVCSGSPYGSGGSFYRGDTYYGVTDRASTKYGDIYSKEDISAWSDWTTNYATVQNKIATASKNHGGGTNYYTSASLALAMIKSREGTAREHIPVNVVIMSDGEPEYVDNASDWDNVSWAQGYPNYIQYRKNTSSKTAIINAFNNLKGYKNAKVNVAIIGVGMPSSGTYSITPGLSTQNFKGTTTAGVKKTRTNLWFTTDRATQADMLAAAEYLLAGSTIQIDAREKVYTDYISEYFDFESCTTSDGTIKQNASDPTKIVWKIPDGVDTKYTAKINVKLKDEYRYKISDTEYATNASANISYKVYEDGYVLPKDPDRNFSIDTPILPYGIVEIRGKLDNKGYPSSGKHWAISGPGTSLDSVQVNIYRKQVEDTSNVYKLVGQQNTVNDEWYITRKYTDDTIPLVLYDTYENELIYDKMTETKSDYFYVDDSYIEFTHSLSGNTVSENKLIYESGISNYPNHVNVELDKRDYDTGNVIKDALFNVFAYSGSGDTDDLANYEIYCYEDVYQRTSNVRPETGHMNSHEYDPIGKVYTIPYNTYAANPSAYKAVTLTYDSASKKYKGSAPLYYTTINQGYFKVVETKTPSGYYGDWKNDVTPNANSTYLDKKEYTIKIQPDVKEDTVTISNHSDGTFRNHAIKAGIEIYKTGEVATGTTVAEDGTSVIDYEVKGLPGAWYVLRAAGNIYDVQNNLLYKKGDIVELKNYQINAQTHRTKLSNLDLSKYDIEKDDKHIAHVEEIISDENQIEADTDIKKNVINSDYILGTYVTETEYMDSDYVYSPLLDTFTLDKVNGSISFNGIGETEYVYVTDNNGYIKIDNLWQGSYEVVEVKAPKGYVRGKNYVIDVTSDGEIKRPTNSSFAIFNATEEYVKEDVKTVRYYNDRQKLSVTPPPSDIPEIIDNDPTISITKKANKEFFLPGETVTYTVTVSNNGIVDLVDCRVTDVMDNDASTLKEVNFYKSLKVGEYDTFTYTYQVPETDTEGTVHDNIVTVVGKSVPDEKNNIPSKPVTASDDEKIKVIGNIGLIKKADKKIYYPDETITYTLYVTNSSQMTNSAQTDLEAYKKELSDKTLHEFVITDTIETDGLDRVTYSSSDMPSRVSVNGDGNVEISYLQPGEVCILKYTCHIPKDFNKKVVDNKATVTDKEGHYDEDIERVYVVDPSIKITKVAQQRSYNGKDIKDKTDNEARYDIIVKNTGNTDLVDTLVYDAVMTDGTFVADVRVYDEKGNEVTKDSISQNGTDTDDDDTDTVSENDYDFDINEVTKSDSFIIYSGNREWIHGGNSPKTFASTAPADKFTGLKIDGEEVAEAADTFTTNIGTGIDQISIMLYPEFMNKLTIGKHLVQIVTSEGTASAQLIVKKSLLPDDDDTPTNPANYKDLFKCDIDGNAVQLGDLPKGYTKKFTFKYTLKDSDIGKTLPNIMIVEALTPTDPKNPEKPQIPVKDEDDEYIYSGIYVGAQKVSDGVDGNPIGTKGALFGLYAAEDITNIYGDVIIKKDTLIESVLTDDNGFANFNGEQLLLGEYVIKELKAPKGCYSSNMIIYIHGHEYEYDDTVHTYCVGGVIRNEGVKVLAYLYDDNTMVELANAKLEVTDVSGNSVDTWVTTNTDGMGYEIYGINPGETYYLREKVAREKYVNEIVRDLSDSSVSSNSVDKQTISFMVPVEDPEYHNTEGEYLYGKIYEETEPRVYRLRITNDFVEGTLRIYKTGEFLDSWNLLDKLKHWVYSVFSFFNGPLEDIEFTITANENIYHPDGVTGLIYQKGDIVHTGVKSIRKDAIELTDDAGLAVFPQMYLGEYTVTETLGKEGLLITDPINFSLAYLDENTPIVYATKEGLTIKNVTQLVEVNITKSDKATGKTLEGAEFELYAAEDITNRNGKKLVAKDTLLESGIVTGKNGVASINSVLAVNSKYYLKEVKAPAGYKIDDENLRIEFSTEAKNYTDKKMVFNLTAKDTRNDDKIVVDKSAPEKTKPGETITFTINTIKNESKVAVDQFTLRDELPKNVYMTDIYTGTYTNDVTLNALYKTNLSSDWKLWKGNMSSTKAETLKVDSLKLASNEYITEFAIEYGTVPAGFSLKEAAYYHVKVGNVKEGEKLVNNIHLTAYSDGKKLNSDDQTTTIVEPLNPKATENAPNKGVKTGDNNYMYIISLIILFMAIFSGCTYTAVLYGRNHVTEKETDLGETLLVNPRKKRGKKLSDKTLNEIMNEK